jgi:hypothetical protein
MATVAMAQDQLMVPVPWEVTDLNIYNIRHGTGGTYVSSISPLSR